MGLNAVNATAALSILSTGKLGLSASRLGGAAIKAALAATAPLMVKAMAERTTAVTMTPAVGEVDGQDSITARGSAQPGQRPAPPMRGPKVFGRFRTPPGLW